MRTRNGLHELSGGTRGQAIGEEEGLRGEFLPPGLLGNGSLLLVEKQAILHLEMGRKEAKGT
jgi:hypothetical protein